MSAVERFNSYLSECPLIAIIRGVKPNEAEAIGAAIFASGIRIIEVPLNSPEPFESIRTLASIFGDRALVGAGTVLDPADVPRVAQVGGQIIVSPNVHRPVIEASVAAGMVAAPGFFTPSEAFEALRAGDLLAGTWVVQTPRRSLGRDLIGHKASPSSVHFTDEQLDAYGAFELQTLEQVLRSGQQESIATVADTIRGKIQAWDVNMSDAEFLNAYYEALRNRLERKLLFGKRRLDKFDKA